MLSKTFIWLKRLLWALILIFLGIQAWYASHIWYWRSHAPSSTSFMREQLSIIREKTPDAKLQYRWVDYTQINKQLKRAVIASEDANFTEHDGVDWEATQKAFEKNRKKGKVVTGASTITQQLAKNLFLSSERSYFRKTEELVVTWMLESMLDKERILEIYLNVVEWGVGVFGAEAASQYYFGISASQLGTAQAAKLAAMLPAPRFYDKHRQHPKLLYKAGIIQKRMSSADLP